MDYLKQLLKNIAEYIRVMSPSQAIMLIGVIAGIIVGGFVVSNWVNSVTYSTLYSNLEASEAGEVVSHLNDQNISYELSDGGSSISIPSDDVYKVRISLASQGLPRSGNIGYSIFDQSNLGMTGFLQDLNFRRALEGELMKTIMQLSGVQAARVHIVMPKERLFREDQKEATASVVLKLSRANGLNVSQMAGITHLVASSVEGLKTENISIIDYNGNLLSDNQERDILAGLTSTQLDVRKNVETYLQEKAQSLLDGVIGKGRSIVRVTAELDFQQVEKTNEIYDPNSAVVRSEEKIEESNKSTEKQEELAESNDEGSHETMRTNYEINKTVEHIINSVGNVNRLSVAVMVDGIYKELENESGQLEMTYQPRPVDEVNRISAIVKNAIGFDAERNDQIEVTNMAFDRSSMSVEQDKLDGIYMQEMLYDIGKKVLMVAFAIFAFLYLRKKASKLFKSLGKLAPAYQAPRKADNYDVEEAEPIETDEFEEEIKLNQQKRKPKLVDQMQKTANKQPEELAKVIKTLMVEQ